MSIVKDLLPEQVAALNSDERADLFTALIDSSPVKNFVVRAKDGPAAVMLFALDDVPPRTKRHAVCRCAFPFTMSALLVFKAADAWSLHEAWLGAMRLTPSPLGCEAGMPLSSDADVRIYFRPIAARPGLDVVLEVSHSLNRPSSFRAVILGTPEEN